MRVLLTGDRGYIVSVLSKILLDHGYEVIGYDSGYFSENTLINLDQKYKQVTKDIRDIKPNDLEDIEAVIHLAGLSNDPLGEFLPSLTYKINYEATVNLVRLSQKAGVSRFIYASSQSMYGVSQSQNELVEDDSEKNPVTAYAKAKWKAEKEINAMSSDQMLVTSFRPSTVFGASPRLRCDIVFNNLVACAFTTGKIEIMSDGSPWRPVVHVRDVCSAFIAGMTAPEPLVSGRAFNVGIENGNYRVKDLAEAAQRAVPGSELIYTGEHGSDSRTYKVSFERILNDLKGYYEPEWDLDKGGEELVQYFKAINFTEQQFRGKNCNRLQQLLSLRESELINKELRFIKG